MPLKNSKNQVNIAVELHSDIRVKFGSNLGIVTVKYGKFFQFTQSQKYFAIAHDRLFRNHEL
jgi:hypothetical protein